jgi:hypothetical protein
LIQLIADGRVVIVYIVKGLKMRPNFFNVAEQIAAVFNTNGPVEVYLKPGCDRVSINRK